MKKTLVVYGSSTGTCQSIAETIAEKLGACKADAAVRHDDDMIRSTRIDRSLKDRDHGAALPFVNRYQSKAIRITEFGTFGRACRS